MANNKWIALSVTTIGVLMAALDTRIMIVGLPQIAKSLSADAEEAIWFTQALQFGLTVSLLVAGKIADIVGRVKLYTIGFALFTIGSVLTSASQDPLQLIVSRGIQGVATAILFTSSIALIMDMTPIEELGFALSINQLATRFGAIAGLTVSGIIISFVDWRFLFYINIPIGIFGTIWANRRLKDFAKPGTRMPIDWIGFVTFTTFITAVLLTMTFLAYGVENTGQIVTIYVLAAVALVSAGVFVINERRARYPLLNFSLFRIREVTGGMTALLLNGTAFGAVLLVISLYFQLILGFTPLQAGLAILPFDFAVIVVSPISGRLSDKFGHLPFTSSGLALTSIALFSLSTVGRTTPYLEVDAILILLGAGFGFFSSPNISAIMAAIPKNERGVGAGMRSTFFNIGFSLSQNLVILIMITTLPYAVVSGVISSGSAASPSPLQTGLFAQGIRNVFFVFGVLNSLAIIPSALRGKKKLGSPEQIQNP
ncbi:MAG: MFS transporter [Thaumarchaeota archaeon]|nr:MFS transporter [Nitrososphaerota archaeon]